MKKTILIFVAFVAMTTSSFAQKANVAGILSSIESSNEDIAHPKKGIKGSTWITRGNRFNEAATSNSSSIFVGMGENEILLLVGKPGKDGEYDLETISGVEYKKFVYPTVDLYIADGKLAFWKSTKEAYEGALEMAKESYFKAVEIDAKSTNKAVDGLKTTVNNYIAEANNMYLMNDYAVASENFLAAAAIASDPLVNLPEAKSYNYFGAVAAIQGGNFEVSAPIFDKLSKSGYLENGDIYYYLGFANEKLGKKELAEAAYLEGVNSYPTNQKVMNQLINFYITSGDDPSKVIPYIKKAQESDPSNIVMVFVEGIAYQNMKDFEKAHAAYERARGIDPKFFDAYYNDGLAYVSEADSKVVDLNKIDITNRKVYSETLDTIVGLLENSAVQFEGAYNINPKSKDAVELLKNSYFRLRDTDPKYLELYNKYNDILKAM